MHRVRGVIQRRRGRIRVGSQGDVVSELRDPRVLFAAERTLLAWNRTSLSLVAFGFVVERAGLLIKAISPAAVHVGQLTITFWLGISFIALGAFVSAYSARQYSIVLRTLTPAEFPPGYGARWGMVVNVAVAVLGALLIAGLIGWRTH
jgi:putative membrane protein